MSAGAFLRKAMLWRRPSLIFFVTAGCDSRCAHCFSRDLSPKDELTPDQVRGFMANLGELDDLSISGGEPMIRSDLLDVLAPVFQIGRPRSCTLPTGGRHPEKTAAVVEHLLRAYPRTKLTVCLPLDGPRELHNKLRGRADAFDKLVATFDALREPAAAGRIGIKLNTTLHTANQDRVPEIIETGKDRFDGAVFHHFESMRGRGVDASVLPPSAQSLAEHRAGIFEYWQRFDKFYGGASSLALAAKRRLYNLSIEAAKGHPLPFVCRADEMGFVLYPNGDLAFCEDTLTIGNIHRNTLDQILEMAAAKVARIDIASGCRCVHGCFAPKSMLASPVEVMRIAAGAVRGG